MALDNLKRKILKQETERIANKFVSEKTASKISNKLFDENNIDENDEGNKLISRLNSFLENEEEKLEKQLNETDDPVHDLDDIENKINKLKSD